MSLSQHAAGLRRARGARRLPKAAPRPWSRPEALVITDVPDERGLLARGRALFAALGHDLDTVPGAVALEAARTADRLDRLDRLLAGGDWFDEQETFEGSGRWELIVNAALGEARQQANVLKSLLLSLGLAAKAGAVKEAGPPAPAASPAPVPAAAPTPLEKMRARREAGG